MIFPGRSASLFPAMRKYVSDVSCPITAGRLFSLLSSRFKSVSEVSCAIS